MKLKFRPPVILALGLVVLIVLYLNRRHEGASGKPLCSIPADATLNYNEAEAPPFDAKYCPGQKLRRKKRCYTSTKKGDMYMWLSDGKIVSDADKKSCTHWYKSDAIGAARDYKFIKDYKKNKGASNSYWAEKDRRVEGCSLQTGDDAANGISVISPAACESKCNADDKCGGYLVNYAARRQNVTSDDQLRYKCWTLAAGNKAYFANGGKYVDKQDGWVTYWKYGADDMNNCSGAGNSGGGGQSPPGPAPSGWSDLSSQQVATNWDSNGEAKVVFQLASLKTTLYLTHGSTFSDVRVDTSPKKEWKLLKSSDGWRFKIKTTSGVSPRTTTVDDVSTEIRQEYLHPDWKQSDRRIRLGEPGGDGNWDEYRWKIQQNSQKENVLYYKDQGYLQLTYKTTKWVNTPEDATSFWIFSV